MFTSLIAQKFSDDLIVANIQDDRIVLGHMNHEDHASDILRCHYGALSQSLQYPIRVAEMLFGERVISKATLSIIKNTAESHSEAEALFVLLRAIRRAVRSKYSNLLVFASVLLKLTSNVPCAKDVIKDYG